LIFLNKNGEDPHAVFEPVTVQGRFKDICSSAQFNLIRTKYSCKNPQNLSNFHDTHWLSEGAFVFAIARLLTRSMTVEKQLCCKSDSRFQDELLYVICECSSTSAPRAQFSLNNSNSLLYKYYKSYYILCTYVV